MRNSLFTLELTCLSRFLFLSRFWGNGVEKEGEFGSLEVQLQAHRTCTSHLKREILKNMYWQNLVKFKDSYVKKWGLIPTEDEPEVARLAEAMFRVRLEVWLTRRLAASAASEVLLAA